MPKSSNSLRVVTYNIDNIKDTRLLLEVCVTIKSMGVPDVVFMQEVHGESAASFLAGNLKIPYFKYIDYSGHKDGLAILSRIPLEDIKLHYFNESRDGYGALSAEIKIKDRKLLLCTLHLDRILNAKRIRHVASRNGMELIKREIFNKTVRSRSVEELLEWIFSLDSNNIIIGGDFNSFPFSIPIRKMSKKFNDALWPTVSYFTGTYRGFDYPFKPRIDFIFHSPDIKRLQADVIKKGPSDHYPVMAVFKI